MMLYLLYDLLRRILFLEQEWHDLMIKKQTELDEREKKLDYYFKIFDILAIRKEEIPEKDDFILKFRRVDMATERDYKEHPEKYAIIEKDK